MSVVLQNRHGTARCFVCGEPSVSYTGHVHVDDETIMLGWCEEHERIVENCHHPTPGEPFCVGCYGRLFFTTGERENE